MPSPKAAKTHALQSKWRVWFTDDNKKAKNYEDRIHDLGVFSTVEELWSWLSNLQSPSALPISTDYHIFRDGVKPMWEDDTNRAGGKWTLKVRKTLTPRLWEALVLGVVGGQFGEGVDEDICGVVMSVRHGEDSISVWHKSGRDGGIRSALLIKMKSILEIPDECHLDYKTHDAALSHFHNNQRTEPEERQL